MAASVTEVDSGRPRTETDLDTRSGADVRFAEYRHTRDRRLRDQLVLDHQGLAVAMANRYRGRGQDDDDLRQVALVGLMKAIDRYDPDRGFAFSSFAVPTILGELKRHFRDHGWTISVPRRLQQLRRDADRTRELLEQELGRPATIDEVAKELGEEVDEVLVALDGLRTCYQPGSLDTDDGREPAHSDDVAAEGDADVLVEGLLHSLPPRERRIVYLRFWHDLTQQEIAQDVGISQMHVSRLLRRSLEQLRQHAGGGVPALASDP